MSRCYALVRRKTYCWTRCRCHGQIISQDETLIEYSPVCKAHQNYFTGSRWKQRIIRNAANLEFQSPMAHHIMDILRDGVASIKREDVAQLRGVEYTYFFYLLFRYGGEYSRDWNPQRHDLIVERLVKWNNSWGPVFITLDDVIDFACAGEKGWRQVYRFPELLKYPGIRYDMEHWICIFGRLARKPWTLELLMDNEKRGETLTAMRDLAISNNQDGFSALMECGRIQDWFIENLEGVYYNARKAIDPFKDELMAVAWMPDRMLDWCLEAGEKESIQARWEAARRRMVH